MASLAITVILQLVTCNICLLKCKYIQLSLQTVTVTCALIMIVLLY